MPLEGGQQTMGTMGLSRSFILGQPLQFAKLILYLDNTRDDKTIESANQVLCSEKHCRVVKSLSDGIIPGQVATAAFYWFNGMPLYKRMVELAAIVNMLFES